MKSSTINLSNGETLFYVEKAAEFKGQKPTILFLHGSLSSNISWYDTITALEPYNYHIISIDLRGFGTSTYNSKCNCFADWAQDLKQFCELKDIKRCIVNGWSFGGTVGMKFAQIAPEIVYKLILTCSAPHSGVVFLNNEEKCLTRQKLLQNQKVKATLAILNSNNVAAMTYAFQTFLFFGVPNYPAEKKKDQIASSFQMRCYLDAMYALATSDIKIENIKAKVLAIHGKKDPVIPFATFKETGEFFKNFVALENNYHMIPFEDPETYNKLLVNFVDAE